MYFSDKIYCVSAIRSLSSMAGTAKTGDWWLEILTGNIRQILSMTWNSSLRVAAPFPPTKEKLPPFFLSRRKGAPTRRLLKSWLEILTQNTNSRSASKIGQPSCAWYIFSKLYLVSILYVNRRIIIIIIKLLIWNCEFLLVSGHLTTKQSRRQRNRHQELYTFTLIERKSLKENS